MCASWNRVLAGQSQKYHFKSVKRQKDKPKYADLFHVKKDLDSFSITNVDTFDAHVDFKHRALVLVSSLFEVSMAFLHVKRLQK